MKKETQKKLITAAILVAVGLIAAGLIADYRFQSSDPQNTVFREYYDSVGWENTPTAWAMTGRRPPGSSCRIS